MEKHKVSMNVYQTLWLQGLFVLQLAIVYTLYMDKFHLYCVMFKQLNLISVSFLKEMNLMQW